MDQECDSRGLGGPAALAGTGALVVGAQGPALLLHALWGPRMAQVG